MRLLRMAKQKKRASFDEIIAEAMRKHLRIPKSLAGIYKDLPPWTKADRVRSKYDIDPE